MRDKCFGGGRDICAYHLSGCSIKFVGVPHIYKHVLNLSKVVIAVVTFEQTDLRLVISGSMLSLFPFCHFSVIPTVRLGD